MLSFSSYLAVQPWGRFLGGGGGGINAAVGSGFVAGAFEDGKISGEDEEGLSEVLEVFPGALTGGS